MVKSSKTKNRKNRKNKGFRQNAARARKINASTPHETCSEQLSPFGGLLAMIKFFDLVEVLRHFEKNCHDGHLKLIACKIQVIS